MVHRKKVSLEKVKGTAQTHPRYLPVLPQMVTSQKKKIFHHRLLLFTVNVAEKEFIVLNCVNLKDVLIGTVLIVGEKDKVDGIVERCCVDATFLQIVLMEHRKVQKYAAQAMILVTRANMAKNA